MVYTELQGVAVFQAPDEGTLWPPSISITMVSVVPVIAIALSVAAIVELLLDMPTSLMALFYRVQPVMADIMAITELLMARSQGGKC